MNTAFAHIRARPAFPFSLDVVTDFLLLILGRCIFRITEVSEGYLSSPAIYKIYLMVLDAMLVATGVLLFAIVDTGVAYGTGVEAHLRKYGCELI